ncbi:hypothetical protein DFA_01038 [Cavenderia fasciculata]|uniref:Uncharacterized protein n=1 Tax=Cavenderia fasciculata TaxID=261658 RepID=F4PQJ6_CACFS|nr:uncharacterized protein DFA_01038 [Cavenderia fasciculata]EGG21163.1 hypothetical protein DFA_01038 [Cavenderia fasciculata]|eukprot:XP_004359013.1 hypothetical protein DFA_01038 [Cavenderia fasciculata]
MASTDNLKEVTAGVAKVASNMWIKSIDSEDGANQDNPTHPYIITNVEQYQPTREMMEKFEIRRNQLDKSIPAGKKLETLNLFFNPTSESQLKKILQVGWPSTYDAVDVSFFSNANKAILDNPISYYKLLIVRVCLGREGVDFTLANGRYRVRDLNGVMTSFLITYRNSLAPNSTPPVSPFKSSTSTLSPASPMTTSTASTIKTSSSASVSPAKPKLASGQLIGDGLVCPSCGTDKNAGNTRYCIRCGACLL